MIVYPKKKNLFEELEIMNSNLNAMAEDQLYTYRQLEKVIELLSTWLPQMIEDRPDENANK